MVIFNVAVDLDVAKKNLASFNEVSKIGVEQIRLNVCDRLC